MGKLFPKKNQEVLLNTDTAKQMLSNVFDACEYEKNRIPMEVLQSYSHYRRERHWLQRFIIIVVFIAFMLLPVLFVTPCVETGWEPVYEPGRPVLWIKADGVLPVESIKAAIGEHSLHVYQEADGTYQIRPDRNGEMVVTVTFPNKQYTITRLEVTDVDMTSPSLVRERSVDGKLEITVEDESGELDFEGIYAVNGAGEKTYPISVDRENMVILFPYPEEDMNIFVPDKCGNILQLVITMRD